MCIDISIAAWQQENVFSINAISESQDRSAENKSGWNVLYRTDIFLRLYRASSIAQSDSCWIEIRVSIRLLLEGKKNSVACDSTAVKDLSMTQKKIALYLIIKNDSVLKSSRSSV